MLLVDSLLITIMNETLALQIGRQQLKIAELLMWSPGKQKRYFITVKCAGDHDLDYMEPLVTKYILKLTRYSGGHIEAFSGHEVENGFTHCHLLVSCEKPLIEEKAKRLWKHGPDTHFSHKSDLSALEHVARATSYILKHPKSRFYREFCPCPKKCCGHSFGHRA